ncbi:apolipoprotein d-like [Plakobranchus ocellatus]|uniref:Apolipoprotein d-like n=1 Tax=Plakobranchus ocellatus TaxID=259542 RepID=A0AAV4C055_9GAST|nr:apolipoprotein d-like [Plakobranchus ocellatus]
MAVLQLGSVTAFGRWKMVSAFGRCPPITGLDGFDAAQYVGTWYEYERFPAPFQYGVDCSTATYTADGDTIGVRNQGTIRDRTGNVLRNVSAEGSAVALDFAKPAELAVTFGEGPRSDRPNYIVQDTDYTNYAVVFSCRQFPFWNTQFAWILTRVPGVAPSNLDELKRNLTAAGLDVRNFSVVDQSGCPGR